MTVVAVLLVDRVGRRSLLLVGVGGMTVMLAVLGLGFFLPGLSGIVEYMTLASMILYVAFYAISLGSVFWLMISEIYPCVSVTLPRVSPVSSTIEQILS